MGMVVSSDGTHLLRCPAGDNEACGLLCASMVLSMLTSLLVTLARSAVLCY
jgi:hypothetical protein